ncbi:hypothetical protein [Streptomyces sp. NPDC001381]|uniref:hypothetical protein n=1 Tax=Streptomyces sp. NPDC001381 TaxID=3364567 RepID=UPI00369DEC3A
MDEEAITIRLTHDQAFVLSDWLHQVMFQSGDLEGIVQDRAVWSPIYAISETLDKTLSECRIPSKDSAAIHFFLAVLGGARMSSTGYRGGLDTGPGVSPTGRQRSQLPPRLFLSPDGRRSSLTRQSWS